eukprot:scaffold2334_cov159-Pinguiococcus_pyrenoidosus.AAC.2
MPLLDTSSIIVPPGFRRASSAVCRSNRVGIAAQARARGGQGRRPVVSKLTSQAEKDAWGDHDRLQRKGSVLPELVGDKAHPHGRLLGQGEEHRVRLSWTVESSGLQNVPQASDLATQKAAKTAPDYARCSEGC